MNTKTPKPWNSKYTDKMPDRYYEYRSQGLTQIQTAKRLGVTAPTLSNWAKDESKPEFQEAFKAGDEAYQAWCEDKVHGALTGDLKFTSGQLELLKFTLKARFREDWAEKKESTININDKTKDLSGEELDKAVSEAIDKLFNKKNVTKITNTKAKEA